MAYAHVGSGGMHIHAVSDGEKAEFAAKVIELAALIYGKCSELGGSIRGEIRHRLREEAAPRC